MIPHLVFTAFWLCKHCKMSVQYLGTKVCNLEWRTQISRWIFSWWRLAGLLLDDEVSILFIGPCLGPQTCCAPTLRLKPSILFQVIWVVLLFFFMMSGLCWVHPSYFAPPYGSLASLRSSCVETMFILLLLHLKTFCDFCFYIFFLLF